MIVGPTGSGKSSILMALLSEMVSYWGDAGVCLIPFSISNRLVLMHGIISRGKVVYLLLHKVRNTSIGIVMSYTIFTESWVQNDTIKNNILFGTPYDEERYKKGKLFLRK